MTVGRATLSVAPVAGALGATVTGIDLARVSEASHLDGLRQALADHLVVFLPGQDLGLDDLERVTELLGGRDVTPFVDPLEDRPYVIRVIKEPTDVLNFANAWHSDLSYLPAPPAYTLLHAWDVPDHGGDTVWSNQYLAYDSLSHGLRATLDGLNAVHSAGLAYGTGGLLDQVKDLTSMAIAPVTRGVRRARPPGRDGPPGHGKEGALPQSGVHDPLRGVDEGGVGGTAGAPEPPQHQRELHLPAALGRPHACHLGQPVHDAQRAERLQRRAPRDVPHQCQGFPTRGGVLSHPPAFVRAPAGTRTKAVRRSGPGAADDRLVEVQVAGRALEECPGAVVEHPAVGGEGPVARHVRSGGDAHHRGVQMQVAGRPGEVGRAEVEDTAVGGDLVVAGSVGRGRDAHDRLVERLAAMEP